MATTTDVIQKLIYNSKMLQCNIVMLPVISNLNTYHSNFPSVNGLIGTWSFLTLSLSNMSAAD